MDDYWDVLKKSKSILGDVYLGITQKELLGKEKSYHRAAEKDIFLCDKCNRTWENVTSGWVEHKRQYILHYYSEVPRWGKEIKTCGHCYEEEI